MSGGLFGDSLAIPLEAQIAEVNRELKMREINYPRWAQTRAMTQAKADRQIEVMRAVLKTLQSHLRENAGP